MANASKLRALLALAENAEKSELARAAALANAKAEELTMRDDGAILWRSSLVAALEKGPAPMRPRLVVRGLDQMTPSLRGRIQDRLQDYLAARVEALLGPLILLGQASESSDKPDDKDALTAGARGVAYRLVENFGAMSRVHFGDELKKLPQDERAKLRKLGMRFGEYTLFIPALLKPAPAKLLTLLWALWTDRKPAEYMPPKAGLVSLPVIEDLPHAYYYASGYRPSGTRAVRIDMLERLAGQIRSDRKDSREGFEATSQMMSLVGCSGEDFESILKSLGYKKHTVKRPRPAAPEATAPDQAAESDAPRNTPDGETSVEAATVDAAAPAPAADAVDETAPETPDAEAPKPEAEPAADPGEQKDPAETAPSEQESQPKEEKPADGDNNPAMAAAPDAPADAAQDTAQDTAAPDEIEVTLWRFAPRRPPVKKQGARRDGPAKGKHNAKGAPNGKRKGPPKTNSPYKGSAKNLPKKGAEGHAPRHRKVADPNSPFAVLAGLKGDIQDKS